MCISLAVHSGIYIYIYIYIHEYITKMYGTMNIIFTNTLETKWQANIRMLN
jgi:hypothetical protein